MTEHVFISFPMVDNDDPIPEAMTNLLALFETALADQRFGELDHAALDGAAAAVRRAAETLAQAEAAAGAARAALDSEREAMLHKAQRALAYARIYAEGSPALMEQLQAITFARPQGRRDLTPSGAAETPRRRGRPPKSALEDSGTLPLPGGAAERTVSPP